MTQPQPQTHSESQSAPLATETVQEVAAVGHQTPGLVVIPQTLDGVVSLKSLGLNGEMQPITLMHSESGQPLTWEAVAVSNKVAAVSGWYPGKLGGWVKLGDWRDGGFAADAWSSDGAGMTAYDAAMRAAKKRA
jgi:hypothetical protein